MVIFAAYLCIFIIMSTSKKPNVFKYMDYRQYLVDHYNFSKDRSSHFSYQYIAQKVGVDTSNLAKVYQKQRHLPQKSIEQFQSVLALNEREFDYFKVLVGLAKSKNEIKAQELFNKLLHLQESQPRLIDVNEYHFYSQWYYTAIYGLLDCVSFRGNYKDLAEMLTPVISVRQAKEAISLLLKLGLICIKENGEYRPTEKVLSTGEEWKSLAVKNFQKQTIELAQRALDKISKESRDITTLTFSASSEDLKKLRKLNLEYRKKVISLISQADNGSTVYQMNMQLFPMSKEVK